MFDYIGITSKNLFYSFCWIVLIGKDLVCVPRHRLTDGMVHIPGVPLRKASLSSPLDSNGDAIPHGKQPPSPLLRRWQSALPDGMTPPVRSA